MMQIDKHLTVFTSCIWQTTSTIVEREKQLFLIDPAYFPQEIDAIAKQVSQIRNGRELVLIFTHGDWDHIAGFPTFSEATIVAGEAIADRLQSQIEEADKFDNKFYVVRSKPLQIPRIDHFISHAETIAEWGVRFLPLPGHTTDMLATLFVEERTLAVGDMLSDVEEPSINHSSEQYQDSLNKVEELVRSGAVERMIPGHGSIASDPAEIMRRIDKDRRCLEKAGK